MANRKSGSPSWVAVVIITLLVCGVSYLAALLISSVRSTGFCSYSVYSVADAEVAMADDGFLVYDGSTLNFIEENSTKRWTYMLGGGYEICSGKTAVAAWMGTTLTLVDINNGTTLYTGTQSGNIESARVSSRYAAALMDINGVNSINIIEKNGKQIFTIDFPQLTVIDYGFYSGGTLLWVMSLDTTGSVPTTVINTYKPSNKSVIGNVYDPEQLMYAVSFESTSVRAVGNTYIRLYDYTGRENTERRKLVYGWFLMNADNCDNALMAFVPTNESASDADMQNLRMINTNTDVFVRMPFPCVGLCAKGNKVYGMSEDGKLMIADSAEGKVHSYALNFQVESLCGITDNRVLIAKNGGNIYIIDANNE